MLSLGPIVEGYTLLLARQHISCCAAIEPAVLPEFLILLKAIEQAQVEIYGSTTFFEHGRTGSCLPTAEGEDHCLHAHLHVVPTSYRVDLDIRDEYGGRVLRDWDEVLASYVCTPTPYLLADNGHSGIRVANVNTVPKQYLRTCLATGVGDPDLADYVAFRGQGLIQQAKDRYAPRLRHLISAALRAEGA